MYSLLTMACRLSGAMYVIAPDKRSYRKLSASDEAAQS